VRRLFAAVTDVQTVPRTCPLPVWQLQQPLHWPDLPPLLAVPPPQVSSVELERVVLQGVAQVAEAAAVGVPAPGGGPEQLYLFLVPKDSSSSSSGGGSSSSSSSSSGAGAALKQQCQAAIRSQLNPLYKLESVVLLQALPRTASNKVMRRVLRDQVLAGRQQPRARL
jgi:acetyl-CoA synthetase